jgi:hypothetical protein
MIDAVPFDPGHAVGFALGHRQLQDTGTKHFILAEGFEGGDGHAGDGNRVVQRIEDFDGISLGSVRGHVIVHQLDDVAATEPMLRHICIEIE